MEENKAPQKPTLDLFYSLNSVIDHYANDITEAILTNPIFDMNQARDTVSALLKNAVSSVCRFNVTGFENQKRKLVEDYKSAKGYERIKIGLTISSLNSRIKDNNVTRSTLKHEDEYIALKSYLKQKGIDLTEFFETLKR